MKLIILILFGFVFITSCETSNKKEPFLTQNQEMRHGWTVFSGPKPTTTYETSQSSIDSGRKLFVEHCSRCHGTNGKGDGPDAKNLKTKPADLTNFSRGQTSHYVLFQINSDTKEEMPKWQDILTPKQSSDLSHYVRSLSKK